VYVLLIVFDGFACGVAMCGCCAHIATSLAVDLLF
jgi:hypothetical protein